MAMFFLLAMPVAPSPLGAIEPLWAEAADLRTQKSYAAAVEIYEQIAILSPHDPEPLQAIACDSKVLEAIILSKGGITLPEEGNEL